MAEEQLPETQEVPLIWVGAEEVPILFVNQFLGQLDDQDGIVLSFGQATPPALIGPPEQLAEQMSHVQFVQVRTVARLGFTRPRIEQLVTVLNQTLDNHERQQQLRRQQQEEQ